MKRKRFQGVGNVLRFNWHFFALACGGVVALLAGSNHLAAPYSLAALILAAVGTVLLAATLAATAYAYDLSGLYSLDWMDASLGEPRVAANIHAGFDEVSCPLTARHPSTAWHVFDFHDPSRHTEVSIKRARAAYPAFPGTKRISTDHIPLEDECVDAVVLMLAAHEIRNRGERVAFFREIHRVLRQSGSVLVVEHLRDLPNLFAYTLGAWHFHPRSEWLATFGAAGFQVISETRINLLITSLVLKKSWNSI